MRPVPGEVVDGLKQPRPGLLDPGLVEIAPSDRAREE
jgi:hypothetical protein